MCVQASEGTTEGREQATERLQKPVAHSFQGKAYLILHLVTLATCEYRRFP